MTQPSLDGIEALNAHGPYNHSVWTGGGSVLTHEEALSGRAHFLAKTLRAALTARFTHAELAEMTILDVGCYDGWILHEISDLPFRRMVGVEPRRKNIRKGEIARSILGIETRVEFREGGLESLQQCLGEEQFDVVLSTGLLHHVESPAEALRAMRPYCRRLLFLETIALDPRGTSGRATAGIEPKDVVYFGRAKTVGLSGHKLESSYYDGSATGLRVVTIPSLETIALSCEAAGFSAPKLEVEPETYRRAVWKGRRPFHAVILTTEPSRVESGESHGQQYERELAAALVPREHLTPLHRRFCEGIERVRHTELSGAAARLIAGRGKKAANETIARLLPSEPQREILRAFSYSPRDKIAVEYGKSLLASGELGAAEGEFLRVTRAWNADWRSVYRSFHYLAAIAERRGDADMKNRYRELLVVANPYYPADAWPVVTSVVTSSDNRQVRNQPSTAPAGSGRAKW